MGGYLLGRTKKGKLALRLAFWAATRNSGLRPGELASRLARELRDSPEIADALVGVRRELGDVGRRLAGDALGRQLDVLADRLHDRTEQRRQEMAGSDQGRPSGDDSTGDDSTGDDSTGDDSTGDDSAGDDSTGDDSTGDDSTGDDSTGDDSTGDDSDDRAASGGGRDRGDPAQEQEQEQGSGARSSDQDAQSGQRSEVEDGPGASDNTSADTTASNEAS